MTPRGQEYNEQIRAETLNKITRAALEVFSEFGYHGTTVKKIAQSMDLSYGLVYHYFPSKAEIFFYLIDIALEKSKSVMDTALDTPGTAWEKIQMVSDLTVREVLTGEFFPYFLITLQAFTQGKNIPGLMEFMAERMVHYDKFEHIISEAQKSGDVVKGNPEILAAAYISLIQGLALLMFKEKDLEKQITPEILNNLLRNK